MNYIFIDESGDLGFSKRGSKYFIISAVLIQDEKTLKEFERIPKKIRQRKLKKSMKKLSELKFSNSSTVIREQFLTRAAVLDISIYSVIVKKENTNDKLADNLDILYNYLLKIVIEKATSKIKDKVEICLDKCMSQKQRNNFETYVKTEFLSHTKRIPDLKVKHEPSHNVAALQVIDFICGAFGYKYNTLNLKEGCDEFTLLIQDKICVEKTDLFTEKNANHTYWS